MRCRMTEDGDMAPVRDPSQMLEGADAVAEAIRSRLGLFYGEWWEDRSIGFRAPQFLINGVRSGRDDSADALLGYIAAYIKNTEDVAAIISSEWNIYDREYFCIVGVSTVYGDPVETEVDVDALFSSSVG